jgi:tripartite-type tricarboxylate transporter receptor subunit TctC
LVAIGEKERQDSMPDVPTVNEALSGFEATLWTAFPVPAKTPDPIIDKLHTSIVNALNSAEVKAKLAAIGQIVVYSGAA